MPPAPLTLAGLLGSTSAVGLIALAVSAEPLSVGAAALIAGSLAVLSIIAAAGVLLTRGRWSRWTALACAAGWFGLAITRTTDGWAIALGLLAMATATAAAGPWIERWLRKLASADGPPPAAVVALLVLLATPAVAGLADPTVAPIAAAWAFSGWCVLVAFLVARVVAGALWILRLAHVPAAITTAVSIGTPASAGVVVAALAATALAWRRDVTLAIRPLVPPPSDAVPIPPELMDPAIMEAAGLDDRGHPKP